MSAIKKIGISLNNTSICEKLNATMPNNINAASALGIKIFLPKRIHSAMAISIAPKTCKSTILCGSANASKNAGKYPIHENGLIHAEIAG